MPPPIFALDIEHHFKGRMGDLMVVSPDVGGVGRARELATRINAPLAIVDKRREKAGEVAEMTVIGSVEGKTCIIVDDICDTAGTLCKAAQVLVENGATEVHSYITHGVLSGPAVERIGKSVMKSLVITDSASSPPACPSRPSKIRIVPTAPMFAQAILNIWNGTSVSSALRGRQPRPDLRGDVFALTRFRTARPAAPAQSLTETTPMCRATTSNAASRSASSRSGRIRQITATIPCPADLPLARPAPRAPRPTQNRQHGEPGHPRAVPGPPVRRVSIGASMMISTRFA
jgi:hypothetical protein